MLRLTHLPCRLSVSSHHSFPPEDKCVGLATTSKRRDDGVIEHTIDDDIVRAQQRQKLVQNLVDCRTMRQAHDKDPGSILLGVEGCDHVFQGRGPDEMNTDVLAVLDCFVQGIIGLDETRSQEKANNELFFALPWYSQYHTG